MRGDTYHKKYINNLKFKRKPEAISGNAQRFTLTIVDSHKAGGRLGQPHSSWTTRTGKPYKQRHIAAACWHAHGDFFDALFAIRPEAMIRAGDKLITQYQGNWQDWNIGSQLEPFYYSEACKCD